MAKSLHSIERERSNKHYLPIMKICFPIYTGLLLSFSIILIPSKAQAPTRITWSPEQQKNISTPSPSMIPATYTPNLLPTSNYTNTPTAAPIILVTPTITPTDIITLDSSAPTITNTFSITPTILPPIVITTFLPTTDTLLYLPIIHRYLPPIPPTKVLFCDSLQSSLAIPDNSPIGINNSIVINDQRIIVDLDITLDINHSWVGDLKVQLSHEETNTNLTLINRPGYPNSQYGCSNDNIRTILNDSMSLSVEDKCASSPAAISGMFLPQNPLEIFFNQSISGTWTINVSDNYPNDTGALRHWCIVASISENPPDPTPNPIIPPLPSQVIINGVTGKDQALPLDCESRSAVDWAKFFGHSIGEISFFNSLPISDNPDKGFVGNVYGRWGQLPPNDYGVHAEPVAELLRHYGLNAYAHQRLSWPELKAEIAAGRPVIVWIVGSVDNGIPVYYTPSDSLHTIVARYEHTVIVTGYTQNYVYYLNGDTIYSKTTNQFLDSWSALGNMAITTQP